MVMFVIQSLLLMAIAYIIGCLIGYLLRMFFGSAQGAEPAVEAAPAPAAKLVEKPKAAPKPKAKPKAKAAPKAAAAAKPKAKRAAPKKKAPAKPAQKDELKRIRGIGPKLEARLNEQGIIAFSQIAAWTAKDQRDIGAKFAFPGRIEREEWVKQAKVLAKGGETEFSKRVDKGEVDSSKGKLAKGALGKKPSVLAKAPAGGGDNLTLIDGVGNAIEKKLFAMGVYKFSQIAKWTKDNQVWIGNELGFPGRPERENWVKDAKTLAAGGATAHSKKVERGEIKSSRKS